MKKTLILLLLLVGLTKAQPVIYPNQNLNWGGNASILGTLSVTGNTALSVTTATSLALGGATIGTNALAVTGNVNLGGATGLFWDETNKRLGIGTTAPSVKLEVQGDDDKGLRITNNGGYPWGASVSTNSKFYLKNSGSGVAQGAFVFDSYSSLTLGATAGTGTGNLYSGNGYFSGNVGIATTNPLAKFHDNGIAMFGAGTGASLTDSSLVVNYSTGSPVLNWYGTDGDTWNIGINTSDGATFNGATTYNFDNVVVNNAPVTLKGYTVATLPAGTVGMTAYVTDATAPTYLGALTGGGAVVTPVFYNGTAWVSY